MSQGILFVVSAPSGAGKTSLVRELRAQVEGFSVSVSHTTRPKRPGEIDGTDYFFTNHEAFESMVTAGAFLEYAKVFDNYYGTARTTVETVLSSGKDMLLEIDWQGARQIKAKMPDCRSVFILPPSREALSDRLRGRGQDDAEIIERRMRDAIKEMSHYTEYDYLIINDDFNKAVEEMRAIVLACRLKMPTQSVRYQRMITRLLD
ncbi:MAG: guanylate kinase [Proteobacteria bacterium]|nr:guanylate kinase [Pseudomonadota bacterium]